MLITAISDTHRKHSQVELDGGDILLHCGDIGAHNKETLINFLGWFQKQPYKHKIFIAGNHDGFLQNHPGQSKYIIDKYNIHYLQDNYVTINEIKIWGSPWSLEFGGWSWMKEEGGMKEIVDLVPEDINIVMFHGPPIGILDKEKYGTHCGSESLLKLKPEYFICGHIHECGGKEELFNDVRYINASVVDRQLEVVNKPMEFNYENKNSK